MRMRDLLPANICFMGIPKTWINKIYALVFVAWVLPALLGSVDRRFPFFLLPVREILEICWEDLVVFCSCVLQIWTMLSVWRRIWYLILLLYSFCQIGLRYLNRRAFHLSTVPSPVLNPPQKPPRSSFNSNRWALVRRPWLRVSRFRNNLSLLNGCALIRKNRQAYMYGLQKFTPLHTRSRCWKTRFKHLEKVSNQ